MTMPFEVGAGNEEQANAWNGDEGTLWAARPEYFDASVKRLHARLMSAAAIEATDRVLDVGCGNGQTTRDAARAASSGHATGIDLSLPMIERAREFAGAEGVENVSFVQGDVQVYPFESGSFDMAVSRFGSMFFADPVAAFANIRRALATGGRLVIMSWQARDRNEWLSSFGDAMTLGRGFPTPPPDAPTPFAHADPERAKRILEDAGFKNVTPESVEEPMYFGRNADEGSEAISTQMAWLLRSLSETDRPVALERLRATFVAHDTADGPTFRSAAWIYSAVTS